MLDKKASLYERDEKGELIAKEVPLEVDETEEAQKKYAGEKISVTPMPRGKLRRIFSELENSKEDKESDFDGDIILVHCKNPQYTKEEIPFIKPALVTCIVNTVFRESGMKVGKNKNKRKVIGEVEDEFGKN